MSEEKKSRYTGQTEARRKASAKYLKESVEDIRIRVPKGRKAEIKAHAEAQGESVNAFIVRAVNEAMEREGSSPVDPVLDSPIELVSTLEPPTSTQINTAESTGQFAETKQNTQTAIPKDLKELLQGKEELVDLDRLLSDMIYQFDVLKAFGSDVLARLLEKARTQQKHNTPNAETLEAIQEVNNMIADGSGEHFTGSTTDFFASLADD